MATILDKDLVRESTKKYNSREIVVTLAANQTISFKLKGMKTGSVFIGIEELYRQLVGDEEIPLLSSHLKNGVVEMVEDTDEEIDMKNTNKTQQAKLEKSSLENPMIPLNVLRTDINTSPMSMDTKVQMDGFLVNTINKIRKPLLEAEAAAKLKPKK